MIGSPVTGRPRRELEAWWGRSSTPWRCASRWPAIRASASWSAACASGVGAAAAPGCAVREGARAIAPPRDLSRTPLFQLLFNMLNFPAARRLHGLRFELLRPPMCRRSSISRSTRRSRGGGVDLELVYNADLFDRGRIEELAAQYELLLRQCAGDPDRAVTSASLVTGSARRVLPDPTAPWTRAGAGRSTST